MKQGITPLISIAICFSIAAPSESQSAETNAEPLKDTIVRMDKTMFNAFNTHNVDLLMSMFTEDVEFYHDKSGLTNQQQTREGFTRMFGNTPDIQRDLEAASLQVYPIKDYGAIEIGTHKFCHKESGMENCGSFPFVMVWRKVGDSWKVSRVISYGH